jgi:hypothetical protein
VTGRLAPFRTRVRDRPSFLLACCIREARIETGRVALCFFLFQLTPSFSLAIVVAGQTEESESDSGRFSVSGYDPGCFAGVGFDVVRLAPPNHQAQLFVCLFVCSVIFFWHCMKTVQHVCNFGCCWLHVLRGAHETLCACAPVFSAHPAPRGVQAHCL